MAWLWLTTEKIIIYIICFVTGFLFFIYTYNDRVQMTAVANKEIVNSREELQEVVNNIFKNIDEAAEEVL